MYHLVVNLIQETFISNKVVFVKSSKKISILLINIFINYSPDTNLYDEQHQFINITCVYVQILLDRYCKWKQCNKSKQHILSKAFWIIVVEASYKFFEQSNPPGGGATTKTALHGSSSICTSVVKCHYKS